MVNLDQKVTLDLLDYLDTRAPLVSKEIQEYQVQKDKGVIEDQLDLKEILESLVHQGQRVHLEKVETQELRGNKDLLETQAKEDQGDPLVSLVAQGHRDYLEWKEDQVQWVHQVHLALLVTQYQLLQQQCQEERQCPEHLGHRDQWGLQVHLGNEELLEQEDLREEEEGLDQRVHPVDQVDKVFLEDQETQGLQAKMAAQGEPILKMIFEKYVHPCLEIACLNLLPVLWDHQVLLEGEGLVDLESLALGVQLVTLESREKQDQEGFLGYLACLVTADHPVSRVIGEYLGILDLLEWEWRDLLGQPVLMDHLDPKGLENLDHKVLEDLLGNSVVVECPVVLALLVPLATASFVKHLRCKPIEEDKRKDKLSLFDPRYSILDLDRACWKHSTTAKVVTNMNSWSIVGPVIFVTNMILLLIPHLLCVHHSSPSCALVLLFHDTCCK